MLKVSLFFQVWMVFLTLIGVGQGTLWGEEDQVEKKDSVYIIPIEGQISKAQLYILRRGLKQALANEVKTVVLSVNTPGGELKTTLEMMEALENFDGQTVTFVKKEAISAGAYISAATEEIYFHPKGILGAAAVIQGTGADIPETLKQKVNSYLRARVRSYTSEYRYRGDVVRAMMDEEFVFKIGEEVIKDKGELLTLTAEEAIKEYGEPPEKLFGAGIVKDVKELLDKRFDQNGYQVVKFELTWSEELARWLNTITPILLGLGMLLLFIEFKTPGFGIFGISGIALLLVVFASSYVAGLAGYEEIAVFVLGVLLLGIEVFIFPGMILAGALGILLIAGSIIYALADTWPTKDFEWTPDLFIGPLGDLIIGFVIAVVGIIFLGRYLLKGWLWEVMILKESVQSKGRSGSVSRGRVDPENMPEKGDVGIAMTDLHPQGEVEINGKRFQARVSLGSLEKGTKIEVLKVAGFALVVKEFNE